MLVLQSLLQFHELIDINLLPLSQLLILSFENIDLPLLMLVWPGEKGERVGLMGSPFGLDGVIGVCSIGHVVIVL